MDPLTMLHTDPAKLQPEDIIRLSAEILAILDPTGVSGVIAAYTYPLCSKIAQ